MGQTVAWRTVVAGAGRRPPEAVAGLVRAAIALGGRRPVVGPPRADAAGVATINQRSPDHALDELPATELMRQVLGETKELIRLETRLARDELSADLKRLERAAVLGAVAAVLALLALSALVMAVVLALGAAALGALIAALVLLLGASVSGALAYGRLPKPPLARTRERLESDVKQLERHIQ